MAPAHQRFGAAHLPVAARAHDLRLIVNDELMLFDRLPQVVDGNARAGFQVFCEQSFDLLEHRRLLQSAEHLQSERVAELARAREHALVHAAGEQDAGRDALAAHVTQRFDPIHARHLQVEQDQGRLAARQLVAKRRGGIGGDHVAADPDADLLDQLQEIGLVIDRQ